MSRRQLSVGIVVLTALFSLSMLALARAQTDDQFVYLPIIIKPVPPPETMVEFRGLWVTRFDWTNWGSAPQSKIDEIVQNAAAAGFNAIYFQVRGEADAYYDSDIEPWARRITGQLGQPPNPYFDPLAYFVQEAHAAGLELHAYMNIYPIWNCNDLPDPDATPTHFYYLLQKKHISSLVNKVVELDIFTIL